MSRRRFYATPGNFSAQDSGATVTLAPEEARHLRDVLRLWEGEEVYVFDGEGLEFRCVVADVERGRNAAARLELRERVEPARPESPLELTLCVALLKSEKFDLVLQKATELGVARIVPVQTKRADVRLRGKETAPRVARWKRLAVEAAKQSGRARVPALEEPREFKELLARGGAESAEARPLRLLFTEREGRGLMETIAGLYGANPSRALALVGPEGGWDDAELSEARNAGWKLVTLGGRVLRAETAALVAAALLQHLFGDLG